MFWHFNKHNYSTSLQYTNDTWAVLPSLLRITNTATNAFNKHMQRILEYKLLEVKFLKQRNLSFNIHKLPLKMYLQQVYKMFANITNNLFN